MTAPKKTGLDALSPRQRQIAELIADGLTDKAIRKKTGLSYGMVRTHQSAIADRLSLDRSQNLRVLIANIVTEARRVADFWEEIEARYIADPAFRHAHPLDKILAARAQESNAADNDAVSENIPADPASVSVIPSTDSKMPAVKSARRRTRKSKLRLR